MIDTEITNYLVNIDTKKRLKDCSNINVGELVSHYYDPKSFGMVILPTIQKNNLQLIRVYWTIQPNNQLISELSMMETYQCLSANQDDLLDLDSLDIVE